MIISASSRTDIPAFYGEWFQNRLDAGYCLSVNPFNGAVYRIGLQRHEVEGFVFWTKNLGPFLPRLRVLTDRGFPFVIQYTINGYPRRLEPSVGPAESACEHMRFVSRTYGSKVGVWRYDPILLTDLTDFDFHRTNFAGLAGELAGAVDEVVVSYASLAYRKARRNLDLAARRGGFRWDDPDDDRKQAFLSELAVIAAGHEMTLRLCAQPKYLSPGVREASCIDAGRLAQVAGHPISGWKPGHRGKQCACDYSRDIGAYDTCLHGCVYCYALSDLRVSRALHRQHDPLAEWLLPPRRVDRKKPGALSQLFCCDREY